MIDLKALQHELKTQDNAITADPLFCVYQIRRIGGLDPDYSDNYEWYNSVDCEVADEKKAKALERYSKKFLGAEPKNWRKVYYRDMRQFVTACLTRKGAEEFIRVNGHNMREPFIYVESMWRNEEMKSLRNALLEGKLEVKA